MLLCLARAELLDIHPGWGGGRVRATAIELEALGRSESELLVEALLADEKGAVDPDVRRALLEKTEGNPLFVEETIRMMLERGGDRAVERIPDSLQALIGARIDRLPPDHRSLLRRAAVIGRVFWAGALEHLSPDVENVGDALDDLLLRDFLLPEARSSISGEVAFRFKHVLIREVAYAGLSKSARAGHHARFAGWLKERAGDELVEIRAYHLDHAVALLEELDGAAPEDLVHDAADALHAAGRRALAREANRSARKLLVRAAELEPTLRNRYRAAIAARRISDLPALHAEMELVARDAEEAGETRIYGLALVGLAEAAVLRDADVLRAKELAERGLEALSDADPEARYEALAMLAHLAWWVADLEEAEQYWQRALDTAREGGLKHQESVATHEFAGLFRIRLELDKVPPLLERAIELAEESGSIVAKAKALGSWASLHYLRGELDEAERVGEQARELLAEAGSAWWVARIMLFLAGIARKKADDARAERLLRESIRILKPLEDRASLCESQRMLAEILLDRGKVDEAERFALEAIETVGPLDRISVATTTMTLGKVRAAQGHHQEAEQLLREAQVALNATGFVEIELTALEALAQFFRERGLDEEAAVFERRLEELAPGAAELASRAERIA
jgi:tetratricopeptide (TPR) repeat protein